MDEDEFENVIPDTNRDYRIKIQRDLSCGFCPPNRGENSNYHERKNRIKNLPKKKIDNDRYQSRKFKSKQKGEENAD